MTDTSQEDRLAERLRQATKYMVRCERGLSVTMLCVILCTMGAQVFARYVMRQPFGWSEELSRLAMIWMSFIAASFIMAEGNHIAVDIWTQRVTVRASRNLQLASYLVVAFSCMMLFVGGLNFVVKVHPVGSATLGIPKSYWYGAVSVALLLMTLHSLVNLVLVFRTGKPFVSEYAELTEGGSPVPQSSDDNQRALKKGEATS
jgi:TRAP-type transport system small permease protein